MIQRRPRGQHGISYTVRIGDSQARTFHRYADAQAYEAKLRDERKRSRAGMETEKPAITYDALCELYLAGYTRTSKDWTARMLAYSRSKWGKVYVRQLEPELVAPWLLGLTGKDGKLLAAKTRHHILERMRAVLEMGVEWRYLERSPVRPKAIQSPGTERATEITPFETWADVETIADALAEEHPPWGQLVRFVCATGLRPGEWGRLTWADLDLVNHEMSIPGTKTEAALRSVPLPNQACLALLELPMALRRTQPVWTTKTGKPLADANYDHWRKTAWNRAFKTTGLPYREPYEMRHTFATLALQEGVPLEIISKLMGHKSIEITRRFYAKFTRTTLHLYLPLLNKIGETHDLHDQADAGLS